MKRSCAVRFSMFLLALTLLTVPGRTSDVVFSCKTSGKEIALTFDDGPHPVHTPEILDILGEYSVKATFFVIGENAEWYPELVRMEAEAGHEIGNHTYSHVDLRRLTADGIGREMSRTENAVIQASGRKTTLMRPPGGSYKDNLCSVVPDGYRVVCWSVDTRDWAHTPTAAIVENVLSNVSDGDIILFHDYVSGESPTPDALRILIPALLEEGYHFVTVSELIGAAGMMPEP